MKKILILIALIGSSAHSFEFDLWKSGMTMTQAIDSAFINKKVITINKTHLKEKRFKKIRTRGYETEDILYTKDNIFDKERTIILYFTKKTKKLYKITIQLNIKDNDKLANFKNQLSKKYDEIRNPNKKLDYKKIIGVKIGAEKFFAIDKDNSYIFYVESVFNQNEVSYINKNLLSLNNIEEASIKKATHKKYNMTDMNKF